MLRFDSFNQGLFSPTRTCTSKLDIDRNITFHYTYGKIGFYEHLQIAVYYYFFKLKILLA